MRIHREFSHESGSERILKIGPHLPKLLLNIKWLPFSGTQCILVILGYKIRHDLLPARVSNRVFGLLSLSASVSVVVPSC